MGIEVAHRPAAAMDIEDSAGPRPFWSHPLTGNRPRRTGDFDPPSLGEYRLIDIPTFVDLNDQTALLLDRQRFRIGEFSVLFLDPSPERLHVGRAFSLGPNKAGDVNGFENHEAS